MISRKTLRDNDFVIIPGGPRHRTRVHLMEQDEELLHTGDTLVVKNKVTGDVRTFSAEEGISRRFEHTAGSWNIAAGWRNTSGVPVSEFVTRWVVPPEPAVRGSQIIFLFNGIETADSQHILQPVLQWGIADADAPFGGEFWCIANWYVPAAGQAAVSPWVRVEPGQQLTGIMRGRQRADGSYDYTSVFQEFPGTNLFVPGIPELVWCVVTLESYGITACNQYPTAPPVDFNHIAVSCLNSQPPVNWSPLIMDDSCGQSVNIINNSGTSGELSLSFSAGIV